MSIDHNDVAPEDLLSKTYHEGDDIEAPDHLDQAVLAMARKASRGNDSAFTTWMKPVGLAIALFAALTIALDVARLPVPAEQATIEPVALTPTRKTVPQESPEQPGAGDRVRVQPRMSQASAGSAEEISGRIPACSADIREAARDWRDCIEMLRESGAALDAKLELEDYYRAFPNEADGMNSNK